MFLYSSATVRQWKSMLWQRPAAGRFILDVRYRLTTHPSCNNISFQPTSNSGHLPAARQSSKGECSLKEVRWVSAVCLSAVYQAEYKQGSSSGPGGEWWKSKIHISLKSSSLGKEQTSPSRVGLQIWDWKRIGRRNTYHANREIHPQMNRKQICPGINQMQPEWHWCF